MFRSTLCVVSILCLGAVAPTQNWHVPGDFATIQEAVDSAMVSPGDRIMVGRGNHAGAFLDKAVEIKGTGGAVIDSGPVHGSGLIQGFRLLTGSDGTTLSHLAFTTDLSIMNAEAVNDVTVTQCSFQNSVQAVTNWRGSRWEITHNNITDLRTRCGGGIGIFVGSFDGTPTQDNVVSHNDVTGTLNVPDDDCGGYSGTGIVLFADYRFGFQGDMEIAYNRAVKNKVSMTSSNPGLVDVVAFEMTDTRDDPTQCVVHDNRIGFNDWRGTVLQMALTPSNLDECNDISRNFGSNRGHGLHPGIFGPGGN